jgi:hypothetical protein
VLEPVLYRGTMVGDLTLTLRYYLTNSHDMSGILSGLVSRENSVSEAVYP